MHLESRESEWESPREDSDGGQIGCRAVGVQGGAEYGVHGGGRRGDKCVVNVLYIYHDGQ